MEGIEIFEYPQVVDNYYSSILTAPDTTTAPFIEQLILMRPDGFTKEHDLLIDLGCGPGVSSLELAKRLGFKRFVGVDGSRSMIRKAHNYFMRVLKPESEQLLKLIHANLEVDKIEIEDSLATLVVCAATASYIKSPENLFSESYRMLISGGLFAVNVLIRKNDLHEQVIEHDVNGVNHFSYSPDFMHNVAGKFGFTKKAQGTKKFPSIKNIDVNDHYFIFKKK